MSDDWTFATTTDGHPIRIEPEGGADNDDFLVYIDDDAPWQVERWLAERIRAAFSDSPETLARRAEYLTDEINLMRKAMQHAGTWDQFCADYAAYKRYRENAQA